MGRAQRDWLHDRPGAERNDAANPVDVAWDSHWLKHHFAVIRSVLLARYEARYLEPSRALD